MGEIREWWQGCCLFRSNFLVRRSSRNEYHGQLYQRRKRYDCLVSSLDQYLPWLHDRCPHRLLGDRAVEDLEFGFDILGIYGRVLCILGSYGRVWNYPKLDGIDGRLTLCNSIIAADYWVIKRRQIDVPALYDPYGRYRYYNGINWQGALAFVLAVAPNLPGLAYSINPTGTHISQGMKNLCTYTSLPLLPALEYHTD